MSSSSPTPAATGAESRDVQDWADLVAEVWSFLTAREAVVDYNFVDMTVEIPRDTGPQAPRATWKLNGTLRVRTSDRETPDGRDESGRHSRPGEQ